ncbi:MAG: hypothetical protein DU430_04995 [Candidatus Tokpelaia sp.]|nr:MAG: hypothetical protein DU430_04995 [Candidatus Tokpelaia sp.]
MLTIPVETCCPAGAGGFFVFFTVYQCSRAFGQLNTNLQPRPQCHQRCLTGQKPNRADAVKIFASAAPKQPLCADKADILLRRRQN